MSLCISKVSSQPRNSFVPLCLLTRDYTGQRKTQRATIDKNNRAASQFDKKAPFEKAKEIPINQQKILTFREYKSKFNMFNESSLDADSREKKPIERTSRFETKELPSRRTYEKKITTPNEDFTGRKYLRTPTGNVYEGSFLNGRFEGRGVMKYADGSKYDGEWVKGKRDGYGVFTLANGKEYEGEWFRDYQDGKVTVRFTSGDVLTGLCRKDKLYGKGVIEYANGDRFEGMFEHGAKHGEGVLVFADGRRQEGYWRKGKYRGPVTKKEKDDSAVGKTSAKTEAVKNVAGTTSTTISAASDSDANVERDSTTTAASSSESSAADSNDAATEVAAELKSVGRKVRAASRVPNKYAGKVRVIPE